MIFPQPEGYYLPTTIGEGKGKLALLTNKALWAAGESEQDPWGTCNVHGEAR